MARICPFMSSGEGEGICKSDACELWNKNIKRCVFQSLSSNIWAIRKSLEGG